MFSVNFYLELGTKATITIMHVCLIVLTLAGSLGRCLKMWRNGLMFKQLPLGPVNVNALKNMCEP